MAELASTQAIVEVLVAEGYKTVAPVIRIGNAIFRDFDAIAVGPNGRDSLVLVATIEHQDLAMLERRIRMLVLALERSESRRPVALILNGEVARRGLESLSQWCRVCTVTSGSKAAIRDRLAGLLPIQFVIPLRSSDTASARFRVWLDARGTDPVANRLFAAAETGEEDVRQTLLKILEEQAGDILAQLEDDL